MTRVGFVFSYDKSWLGGVNYFRNLLTALYNYPERKIEAVIFTGFGAPTKYYNYFPDVKVVRSRLFDRWSFLWVLRKFWFKLFSYDLFLERLLKKNHIDVLSHSGWIGHQSKIPTIGWIPDFQHIHLPTFFNESELEDLDSLFYNMCRLCSCILVSSYDYQKDLYDFSPDCKNKSEVLQFVF